MDFPKGLIVSCQALEGNPFRSPEAIALLAQAAELGGAAALRINGTEDISAVRSRVQIPIIGINKKKDDRGDTIITPDFNSARETAAAGADIIAVDATLRNSNMKQHPKELICEIKEKLGLPVMADISTLEEAARAVSWGADAVSTTLSGYMPGVPYLQEEKYIPNLTLVEQIVDAELGAAVVAEGRFWNPDDVKRAFLLGIDAIVIGKAITNPMAITVYYNSYIKEVTK